MLWRCGGPAIWYQFLPTPTPPTTDPRVDGEATMAAFNGDVEALRTLIEAHGPHSIVLSPSGPQSWSPLMVACYAGQCEAVRFLLDTGNFALEERDACLRTPIHLATKSGHINVVRLLLERGADPDRMDEGQRTALIYAAAAHDVPLLSCLLDGNADPDASDQSLRCSLHYLAEGGRSHGGGRGGGEGRAGEEAAAVAGVRLLLLFGAHPGLGDSAGHTPLHLAAASSRAGMVRLLLGLGGADPTVLDGERMTPLLLAKSLEVEGMLRAAPFQAFTLKKLRCCVAMELCGEQLPHPEEGEEEEEKQLAHGRSLQVASAHRVQHAVWVRRQGVEPPRPLPHLAFHHGGEGEAEDLTLLLQHPPPPPPDLAARVLEEAVRHMNGDTFREVIELLWPWSVE